MKLDNTAHVRRPKMKAGSDEVREWQNAQTTEGPRSQQEQITWAV